MRARTASERAKEKTPQPAWPGLELLVVLASVALLLVIAKLRSWF